MAKVGWYTIGKSTTLESNKSHRRMGARGGGCYLVMGAR